MLKAPPKATTPKQAAKRRTTTERGYGYDWQQFRRREWAKRGGYCVLCWEQDGRVVPMDELHHIVPIEVDRSKRLDPENVMPLCKRHHEEIHDGQCTRNFERELPLRGV